MSVCECVTILLRVSVLVCVRAHGSPVRTVEYRVCQLGVRVGCGHACVVATTRTEIFTQTAHFFLHSFDIL